MHQKILVEFRGNPAPLPYGWKLAQKSFQTFAAELLSTVTVATDNRCFFPDANLTHVNTLVKLMKALNKLPKVHADHRRSNTTFSPSKRVLDAMGFILVLLEQQTS